MAASTLETWIPGKPLHSWMIDVNIVNHTIPNDRGAVFASEFVARLNALRIPVGPEYRVLKYSYSVRMLRNFLDN